MHETWHSSSLVVQYHSLGQAKSETWSHFLPAMEAMLSGHETSVANLSSDRYRAIVALGKSKNHKKF